MPPPGTCRGTTRAPAGGDGRAGAALAPAFQETEIETAAGAAPVPRPRRGAGGATCALPRPREFPAGPGGAAPAPALAEGGRRCLSRRPAGKRDGERGGPGRRARAGRGCGGDWAACPLALRLGRLAAGMGMRRGAGAGRVPGGPRPPQQRRVCRWSRGICSTCAVPGVGGGCRAGRGALEHPPAGGEFIAAVSAGKGGGVFSFSQVKNLKWCKN